MLAALLNPFYWMIEGGLALIVALVIAMSGGANITIFVVGIPFCSGSALLFSGLVGVITQKILAFPLRNVGHSSARIASVPQIGFLIGVSGAGLWLWSSVEMMTYENHHPSILDVVFWNRLSVIGLIFSSIGFSLCISGILYLTMSYARFVRR